MSTACTAKLFRSGQVLAALAGALALGMASAWTVAAWQEPETATSSFSAGSFETQSQAGSGRWAHHPAGTPAPLPIETSGWAPGGTRQAPAAGDSKYTWINLRTASTESRSGTGYLRSVAGSGALAAALEYRAALRTASSTQCSAADFGTSASYLAGSEQSYLPVGAHLADPEGFPVNASGTGICLELRVAQPGDGDQGQAFQGRNAQLELSLDIIQN
ncbi:hypothetical protein [Glutamicibacter sp.]|uniref:hypothetical protein n=1 Tax=Glutamicibacter sp. TaxID=1931995 RepID=UPI003D6B096A